MTNIYNVLWRFCVAVSAILSLAAIALAFTHSPSVSESFKVNSPNINDRIYLIGECQKEDASKYFSYTTSNGRSVFTHLCFASHPFAAKNGQETWLVPYKKTNEGALWGHTPYSDEVTNYANKMAKSFKMTKFEEKNIEEQYWVAKWQKIVEVVGGVLAFNAIFWTLFYVMVWVFTGGKKKVEA